MLFIIEQYLVSLVLVGKLYEESIKVRERQVVRLEREGRERNAKDAKAMS